MQIKFDGVTGGTVEIEATDRQQARCNTAFNNGQAVTTQNQFETTYPADFRLLLRNTQENFFMHEYLRNGEKIIMHRGAKSVVSNVNSTSGGSDREAMFQIHKKQMVHNQAKENQYRMRKKNTMSRFSYMKKDGTIVSGVKNSPRLGSHNVDIPQNHEPDTKEATTPVNVSDLL